MKSMVQIISRIIENSKKSANKLYLSNIIPLAIINLGNNLYNIQFIISYIDKDSSDNKRIINIQVLSDREEIIKSNELYIDNLDQKRKELYDNLTKNIKFDTITDFNISKDEYTEFYKMELVYLLNKRLSFDLMISKNMFIKIGLFLSDLITKDIVFLNIFTESMYNYMEKIPYNKNTLDKEYTKIFMHSNTVYYVFKKGNNIYYMEQEYKRI